MLPTDHLAVAAAALSSPPLLAGPIEAKDGNPAGGGGDLRHLTPVAGKEIAMTNDADQTREMVDKYGWKPLLGIHREASIGKSLDSLAALYGVSLQEADRMRTAGRHAARMRREQRAYEDAIRD